MQQKSYRRFKIYGAILLALSVIGVFIYYKLGGFDGFNVKEIGAYRLNMVGVTISEETGNSKIKDTFELLKSEVQSGQFKGSELGILTHFSGGSQFMGLVTHEVKDSITHNYEVRSLQFKKAYQVHLTMHNLVMPLKETVQKEIIAYAKTRGTKIDDVFLEIYHQDNTVTIYGYAKE